MNDITEERGINATLIRQYVKERFGADGVHRVAKRLSDGSRGMFLNTENSRWYPVELMREIYFAVDAEFAQEDPELFFKLGRYGAEESIKGFLRFLTRNLFSVEQLLKRTNAFWKSYHRGGEIRAGHVVKIGHRRMLEVITDGFNLTPQACQELEGWMESLTRLTGVTNIAVLKKTCVHKGDSVCSWEVSWE